MSSQAEQESAEGQEHGLLHHQAHDHPVGGADELHDGDGADLLHGEGVNHQGDDDHGDDQQDDAEEQELLGHAGQTAL